VCSKETILGLHDDVSAKGDFQGMVVKVATSSEATSTDKIGCYVLLGPSVYPAHNVGAGNIVGIVGLEEYVLKTATLSDSWACFPLKAITFQSKPMLKVAVEPVSHKDLKALEVCSPSFSMVLVDLLLP
jgi:ribosome assembly protein 1